MALIKLINKNIKYPTKAKADNIQGRVILRFVINKEENAEDPIVLKGVHPLLDAEAVRVVSMMSGWKPGLKAGKPVSVYSLPVTFSLAVQESLFSETSISGFYRFINMNIIYPEQAKESSDTGRIFVVVKLNKGGITKECKVVTDRKEIKVPVLEETVIVGYATATNSINSIKSVSNEHPALKTECLRIANMLSVNEIPDWKDKDMEFALAFKFILK